MRQVFGFCIFLSFLGATSPVFAESSADDQQPTVIGLVGEYGPRYDGSKKDYWQVLPLIQARSKNGIFFIDTTDGVGYDLQANNGLYFEHVLGYTFGREDKNSTWSKGGKDLQGIGSVPDALNTAVAVGWEIKSLGVPDVIPELRAIIPLTHNIGTQYLASLTVVPLKNKVDTVSVEADALWGDNRYLNTWFGINSQQSKHSQKGFAVYQPAGGMVSSSLGVNWTHQLTPHWGTVTGLTYSHLSDQVAKSPIVERRDALSGTFGVTYTI